MPRLKRLRFHIPMSSPHRMRMFGLFALAISISFARFVNMLTAPRQDAPGPLYETHQHGHKGKHTDEDEEDCDRNDRSLKSLLCHTCDGREIPTPQVMNRPMVLPDRNQKGQYAAG